VANSFSIYTGSHCLVVAASSEAEKTKWMEDLQMAIINARRYKNKELSVSYPSLKSNSKRLLPFAMIYMVGIGRVNVFKLPPKMNV